MCVVRVGVNPGFEKEGLPWCLRPSLEGAGLFQASVQGWSCRHTLSTGVGAGAEEGEGWNPGGFL